MSRSYTSRVFTLPDTHLAVLEEEARRMGLSVDGALTQAIVAYQAINAGRYTLAPACRAIDPDGLGLPPGGVNA